MAWYNASWGYRFKATVLATKVDADLTDYPVYLNLADAPAGFHTNCNQTDARDIRITTSDETTEVPREVVFYDSANNTGEVYFKGTVANATNTDFYVYYGNAGASEPAANATYGKNNVWTNYVGVWHLHGSYSDSTSNAWTGSTTAAPDSVTGKIGTGYDFVRANSDFIEVDSSQATALRLTATKHTIQCWVNHGVSTAATHRMINMEDGNNNSGGYSIYMGNPTAMIWAHNTGSAHDWSFDPGMTSGTWYKTDFVYDQTNRIFYRDGASIGSTGTTTDLTSDNDDKLNFGRIPVHGQYFNGKLDEIRISAVALSATWLSTEYNNQSSSSTFFTIGSEEAYAAAPTIRAMGLLGVG